MNALTMSATRRRDKVVILTGPAIGAQSSTPIADRVARVVVPALCRAWWWCTPTNIVRALFSSRACAVVATVALAAAWWHAVSIADPAETQAAVGADCLAMMPWAVAAAIRMPRNSAPEKGGSHARI